MVDQPKDENGGIEVNAENQRDRLAEAAQNQRDAIAGAAETQRDSIAGAAEAQRDVLAKAAIDLSGSVGKLAGQLKVMDTKIDLSDTTIQEVKQTSSRVRLVVYVIIVVVLLAGSGIGVVLWRQHNSNIETHKLAIGNQRRQQCMTDWAAKFTARNEALRQLAVIAAPRQDALDQVVRSLRLPTSQAKEQFNRALTAYFTASDAYIEASKTITIPPAPIFDCK